MGISFFLTKMLEFADVSSPSLMAYGLTVHGQFIDLQRPSFTLSFSFGGSHGISGSEKTIPGLGAIIAHEQCPQGALLPESGSFTRTVPIRCNCPGLGRFSTDYDGS